MQNCSQTIRAMPTFVKQPQSREPGSVVLIKEENFVVHLYQCNFLVAAEWDSCIDISLGKENHHFQTPLLPPSSMSGQKVTNSVVEQEMQD